ncbi:hypothetical protein [Marinospirillum perlucidum]|uniref:hypothetical protein n=1 Tax=Marinospirillum perlucidum TaxID=1982602 RepID=UPI000DF25159|nr:hypothetical protein [Marinospirillum perlucidum]
MSISRIKLTLMTVFLAATFSTFSVFAQEDEGHHRKPSEGMHEMSGVHGMEGMMEMMSEMSPEDRQAMIKACTKMMQNHDSNPMHGTRKNEGAEAN